MDGPATNLTPKRVAVFFTAVEKDGDEGEISEIISRVADDAEARGLFFEWAAIGDMDINDVVTGSPLHQAMTGHFPDR